MKEVSCRVFEILIRAVADKGVDPERMVAGTTVTLATLRNKNARIDWTECCAVMANLRPIFTDAEYVEIGRSHFRSRMLRFVFVVARLRFTPMGFYRWLNTPREGVGNQLFTCIVPSTREISDHEIEVDLVLKDGYEVCWEFFTITTGNFMEMPRLLGYPEAHVEVRRLPRGSRFHITVPQRTRFWSRIWRTITWPFTVRAAARELQEAHATLQERVLELEAARATLAQQAEQLTAANQIAALALGDLSPTEAMRGACAALVEHADCDRATVTPTDGADVTATAAAEHAGEASERTYPLVSGAAHLGELVVVARADAAAMIESLVPTIALVVQKALDQQALAAYQLNLERRVADRTAALTQARDELTGTVARLEEAQASREKLFHNISHEIRTPLALVLLLVDGVLTHHRAELTERAVGQMNAITVSTRKLVRLVDELLLLASGQERNLAAQLEPVDLGPALPTLLAGWTLAAREAGLTLELDATGAGPVLVDVAALERVLANLLSNAIKFTPRGGRVTVTTRRGPARTELAVADDGPGIDPAFRPRLFERFEQGEAGRRLRSGSGIGLSIARELVRAHGGELEALDNPTGRGARFVFTIANAEAAVLAQATPGRLRPSDYGVGAVGAPTLTHPPGLSRGHILIAEDDVGLAQAVAQLLADEYTVTVTHDGTQALAAATSTPPDLLITDIEMPGLDGLDLARQIQAIPGEAATPVLVMSARAQLGDRLAGFDAGAVDYLIKPFDPAELRARVRAQLAYRGLAQRLYRTEKLAAMGALSAGLAHELRNPANGIVNAIEPLRELLPPAALDPETGVGELLDVIQQCAEQIAYVSRQLLGFRRSGDLDLRQTPLREVVTRAVSNASAALTELRLETDHGYAGTIRCAAPLLTQVLVNLLENAAHAAGPGGWVRIASTAEEDQVLLLISDSGPGVPPGLQEKIFEPFFTTKPPGQGTGLGLATARDLITRHGGTLDVRLREGRTTFVIALPFPSEARR